MKKICTILALLTMFVFGAKATTIEKDVRFYTEIASYKTLPIIHTNVANGIVSLSIDKNFNVVLTLPNKSTPWYPTGTVVTTILKDVPELGIDSCGFSKDYTTKDLDIKPLYQYMPNIYKFQGKKKFTLIVGDLRPVTYTVTKEDKGSFNPTVIKMVPDDVENASKIWNEIAKHVATTQNGKNDAGIFIAEGSYVQNGKELMTYNTPCILGLSDVASSIKSFDESTGELGQVEENTDVIRVLNPSSQIAIGNTSLTLMDKCSILVKDRCISGFLNNVKSDVAKLLDPEQTDPEDMVNKAITHNMYNWLEIIDQNIFKTDNTDIKMTFTAPEPRIAMELTSAKQDGTDESKISLTVDENFTAKLKLPSKKANIYAAKMKVDLAMNNIKRLNIEGTRTYSKEYTSSSTEWRNIYDQIPNLYDFTGYKIFNVTVDGQEPVVFTASRKAEADGTFTITMVPDNKIKAQSVWAEITKHITADTKSDNKSQGLIAKGSYIKNGDEYFKFVDDCYIERTSLREALTNIQNNSQLSTIHNFNNMSAKLEPSSILTLGNTYVTLNDPLTITVDNMYNEGFLSEIRESINKMLTETAGNDRELKKQFAELVLDKIKNLDDFFSDKSDVNITISFKEPETRLNVVYTSTNADNTESTEVSLNVNEDFVGKLYLPSKVAQIYASKNKVDVTVNNIAALDIKGERSYSREYTTTKEIDPRNLYDHISALYDFDGIKEISIKVDQNPMITYFITKEEMPDKTYVITFTPDSKENVKTSWHAFTDQLDNEQLSEKSNEMFIKQGSYLINADERAMFTQDCTINRTDLRSALTNVNNKVSVETITGTNKVEALIKEGTYVSLGHRRFTLKSPIYIAADNENNDLCMNNGFLSDVQYDINDLLDNTKGDDSKLKKDFVNLMLTYIKKVNDNLVGKSPINITVSLKGEPTAINTVKGQSTSVKNGEIYTVSGYRVSNINEHGIYIVNGKKIVK